MEGLITAVVIVAAVFVGVFLYMRNKPQADSTSKVVVIPSIRDGKKETQYTLPIPLSENKDGIEFSYAGWVQIDDWTFKNGIQKAVFIKGADDSSLACPGLLLDASSNTLLVKIDTYGSVEVIPVPNIPAKKWLHFAIAISQTAADVYINGTLYTHHTLNQIPKQNTGPVYVSSSGGFSGKLGLLEYYPSMLNPEDVASLSLVAPEPDSTDQVIFPPYFDVSWWTSHDK